MNIPIIYEDDNYIIFNKPAGLIVHPDGRTKKVTLVDWILENRPETKDVGELLVLSSGEKIERPGIVHRLDRETSGAIAVAKNTQAFLDLKEKFHSRQVKKKYHVFVYGSLKEDDGIINRPIGRSKSDFRKWSAQRGARGEMREAITAYKVLSRRSDATFVEAEPKTGRTHQIRVHFKAIHHPVVADSLYAEGKKKILGFERLALHSFELSFVGLTGETVSVRADYPEDFKKAVDEMVSADIL